MLSVGSTLLLSVLFRAALVSTAPTLAFPINSQVPPVARIGDLFSFVFASSTFTSSSRSNLSYSLTDPPSWLSLDSDNRRLYGTPQDSDVRAGTVVGIKVALVATDSTGSTSDDVTLVVSRNPGPSVQIPISEQIQSFGKYSEPSSILFYPDQDFKLTFANDTFSDPDTSVFNYYTVMVDNSPLPAWVSFDPGTLAFVGTTPPFSSLVEPPQTFSMKLIASDVTGFSATSVNFSIVVGTHTLTTDQPSVTLNATAGNTLSFDGLAGSIQVDGKTAGPSDVNVTTENLPAWLSFDPSSWDISGTAPDNAQSTKFTAIFEDAYADVLNITLDVQIANSSSLFQSKFPELSVKTGGQLLFNLASYLTHPSGVDATADIQPATPWISWDASSMTLSGNVPNSASKSVIDVTFTVQAKGGAKLKRAAGSQSQNLTIQVETTASSATPVSTIASTSSTAASTSTNSATSAKHNPNWTIVAIVISIVAGLAIIACLCFYCCNKRRKKRDSQSTIGSGRISAPLPQSLIYTPGHAPGSPSPEPHTGPPGSNEKEKTKARKASNLRSELTPPPAMADVYNDGQYSDTSTPGSKLKEWFASLRSVRFVTLRRANPRVSSTFLPDDGSSHHDLDLDLEFAPGPPVLNLPYHSGSQGSFRRQMEEEVPALSPRGQTQDSSLERTEEEVASSGGDLTQTKGKNILALPTPNASSIRLVERDPFRDTPIRIGDEAISPLDERDPFNSHPISPISPMDGGPTTPYSAPGPSSLLASSSLLPTSTQKPRRATTTPSFQVRSTQYPALRPAHSQKSVASHSSTDTYRGRTRNKFAAKARGALFALQSPKRRTLAALGKRPSFTVPRKKRSHRGILESVDCDSESVLGGVRGASRAGSRGGIAGFLSPRLWPQPGPGHPPTVPTPKIAPPPALDSESHRRRQRNMSGSVSASASGSGSASRSGSGVGSRSSRGSVRGYTPQRIPNPPIRRRPVGAPARSSGGSGESVSTPAAAEVPRRNPLRTPVMSSSPFGLELGLGIMGTTYEDLVNSSPFHPSREGRREDRSGEDGGGDEDSWTDIRSARSSSLPTTTALARGSGGPSVTGSAGWTSAREATPSVPSVPGHSAKSSALGGKNWITHGGAGGLEVEESPVIPKGWRRPSAGESYKKMGGAGGGGAARAGDKRAVSEGIGDQRNSGTTSEGGGGSGTSKASSDGRAFV